MFDVNCNLRKLGRRLSPHIPLSAPLPRLWGFAMLTRRSALALPLLLALALAALTVLFAFGGTPEAQAQDGGAPPVSNLRCIAETERVAFLWDVPEWSGGEATSYDYELTLPNGREEGGRLHHSITLVYRPGSYPVGQATRFKVTANYETSGGGNTAGAEAALTCYVGGARPLVITPVSATRQYGGTDALGYTVSGLVDGDAAGDVVSGSLARDPGDDAGSYAINLGTLAIAPDYVQKYALPAGPAVATYVITPRPAAYTATGVNKAYDGTTAVTAGLSGGFAAGDILSGDVVTVSGGTYAQADAGTGIAVTGVSAGGADAGNYQVTFSVSGAITPRMITAISGVRVNSRQADGTTNATFDTGSARVTGVLPGDLADLRAGGLAVSGAFPSAEAGSWEVSATYSLQDHGTFKASNYTLSPSAVSATLRGELHDEPPSAPPPQPVELQPEPDLGSQPQRHYRQGKTSDGQELLMPPCQPGADRRATPAAGTIKYVMCEDHLTIESVATMSDVTFYPAFSPDRHNYVVHVADSVTELRVQGIFREGFTPYNYPRINTYAYMGPGYAATAVAGEAAYKPDCPDCATKVTAKNTGGGSPVHVRLSPGVTTIEIKSSQWFKRSGSIYALPAFTSSGIQWFYSEYDSPDYAKMASRTYTLQLVWQSPDTTLAAPEEPDAPTRTEDYDADDDGLIEVSTLSQLDAIRWDLDGDGYSDHGGPLHDGFPDALLGMGCPTSGCVGYELAASLDLDTNSSGGGDSGDDYWNSGHGWVPIGTDTGYFRAIFEGNGRVISNLYINADQRNEAVATGYMHSDSDSRLMPGHKGLFEKIGARGVVRNVGLANVDVSRTFPCQEWSPYLCVYGYVGGLAGVNHGKISGSWVTGSVANAITRAYNFRHNDPIVAGGLVGSAGSTSVISGSYSTARVSARKNNWSMSIGSDVGGLAGNNRGSIIASYAAGTVFSDGSDPLVSAQWAAHYAGGLVGDNRGTITASYSTGRVLWDLKRTGLVGIQWGGLFRSGHGRVTASYWDTESSGQARSSGGVGKTTAELQGTTETSTVQNYTPYTGIYADWNVDLDGDGSGDDPWDFGTDEQYPALASLGETGVSRQRQHMQSALSERQQPWAITYAITPQATVTEGRTTELTITLSQAVPAGLPNSWAGRGMAFVVRAGYDGDSTASAADLGRIPLRIMITTGNTTGKITIPTVADAVDEDDETFTVTVVAPDLDWGPAGDGRNTATITITDDDTAGVTVSAANPVSVSEGGTATYTVVLDSRPTADVTITPTSADDGAVTVSPASHTFRSGRIAVMGKKSTGTPSNWNTPVTFTVSGVADTDSNDETVGISHQATSQDTKYNSVVVSSVRVSVSDTTTAGQQRQDSDSQTDSLQPYTDLIAQMYEWRNGPEAQQYGKPHTDRWDRALLAFGETVADATLTPMTAAEAQALADQDWGVRWVPVARALWQIEGNRAPTVAAAIADVTIVSESGTKDVSLSGVFSDADNDGLTITAASSDEAVATVSVAGDQSSLTVSARARGTATITVTADDSKAGAAEDSFTVTVKAAPVVASALADLSGLEQGATQEVSLSGVFSDADGDALTVTAASSDETKATVTVAADYSSLTVTGVAGGTATITVTAQDADGNRASDQFDVTVAAPQQQQQDPPPNRAPTVAAAIADVTIVNESGTRQVSLSGVFADADNDPLTVTAASSGEAVATVSVASDYSTLTVSAQSRGAAAITVTANDGNGGTVSDSFTVTVKAAPVVASALADVSGLEEGSTRDVSLSGVFSDADGDPLTVTAASSANAIATVTVASDGSKLTVTGVSEGTATITVTAQDSDGNRASDDFAVAVVKATEPEQDPPPDGDPPTGAPVVAAPIDDFSLEGPEHREIDLNDVFHDPDGGELTFRAVSSNYGVASMWVDGSTLVVVGTGTGTATITVTAEDPDGNTVSDEFEVTARPLS